MLVVTLLTQIAQYYYTERHYKIPFILDPFPMSLFIKNTTYIAIGEKVAKYFNLERL